MSVQTTEPVDLGDMRTLAERARGEWAGAWAATEGPWLARAAVPLDCMGGFAEYGGSVTLTLPTSDAVCCAAQLRTDEQVQISLLSSGGNGHPRSTGFPLSMWYQGDRVVDIVEFRARTAQPAHAWARPALGVLHAMLAAGDAPHLGGGLSMAFELAPDGSADTETQGGLRWEHDGRISSAAAAATAAAVARCLHLDASALDMARWCHAAETQLLGLPCGLSSALCALEGRAGSILQVQVQPQAGAAHLPLPEGVMLIGVDCGPRHAHAERKYRDARTCAFMGRRIVEHLAAAYGLGAEWGRHLARLSVNDYVGTIRDHLPTKLRGRDFTARFGALDDPFCEVADAAFYKVRSRTEHHIYENTRVHEFAERLGRAQRTREQGPLFEAGELMLASHWSYGQRCGLGSIETDRLVTLLRRRGPAAGIFGAKISGCGAGGSVVILAADTQTARDAIHACVDEFTRVTGRPARLCTGGSNGALVHGVCQAN